MKRFFIIFLVLIFILISFASCATVVEADQETDATDTDESTENDSQQDSTIDEEGKEDEVVEDLDESEEQDVHTEDSEDLKEETEQTDNSEDTETEKGTADESETVTETNADTESSTESNDTEVNENEESTDTEKSTETNESVETEGDVNEEVCAHTELENGKCLGCDVQFYTVEGEMILFGEYPQTIKSDSVEILSATPDARGYYLGSDNAYYVKVVADPFGNGYEFSSGKKIKDGNAYYFKVEPIKWRIISKTETEAVVLCESVLINKAFDADSNNYADSDLVKWLREDFLNTAFDSVQKEIMRTVIIDGSSETVFLASEAEAFDKVSARKVTTTDFARANGTWISTAVGKGNGIWWLRDSQGTNKIKVVTSAGVASNYELVTNASFGVLPALKIIF